MYHYYFILWEYPDTIKIALRIYCLSSRMKLREKDIILMQLHTNQYFLSNVLSYITFCISSLFEVMTVCMYHIRTYVRTYVRAYVRTYVPVPYVYIRMYVRTYVQYIATASLKYDQILKSGHICKCHCHMNSVTCFIILCGIHS